MKKNKRLVKKEIKSKKQFGLAQGNEAIKIARQALDFWFAKKLLKPSQKKWLQEKHGIFVTLHEFPSKHLRGCIGFPYPSLPLGEAIIEATRAAAFSDPRFLPVEKSELDKIIIEISILTVPEEIKAKGKAIVDEIEIARDGLIVHFSGFSGLLLPQVAPEQGWSKLEFLRGCCEKAGVPRETWLNPLCKIFKFQAKIFSETKPRGKVVGK